MSQVRLFKSKVLHVVLGSAIGNFRLHPALQTGAKGPHVPNGFHSRATLNFLETTNKFWILAHSRVDLFANGLSLSALATELEPNRTEPQTQSSDRTVYNILGICCHFPAASGNT